MKSKSTLIFDFDGTIADTFSYIIQTAHDWIPGEIFDHLADKPLESLRHKPLKDYFNDLKIPNHKLPIISNFFHNHLSKNLQQLKLIKHIDQPITQLHQSGYQLGIVTSNRKSNTRKFLQLHQLEFFDFIHSSKHIFGKHQTLKRIIKFHNLSPKKTLYVGDEVRDIEAAHKAGIKIISVSWGLNTSEVLKKHHPDFLIHKPNQLPPLISKLHKQTHLI